MKDRDAYINMLLTTRKRDRLIHRLRERGWPMQRIADKVGVSRQRVHQILNQP